MRRTRQWTALLLLLLANGYSVLAYHVENVICNPLETDCQVAPYSIWHVRQCGYGCTWASTVILLQCFAGFQAEEAFFSTIEGKTGIDRCTESPVGLFGYCDRMDHRGMKYLLQDISGIATTDEVYLPAPPNRSNEAGCVSTTGYPTWSEIQYWIKDKRPFALSVRESATGNGGHVVVVYGFQLSRGRLYLRYHNPFLSKNEHVIEYIEWQTSTPFHSHTKLRSR